MVSLLEHPPASDIAPLLRERNATPSPAWDYDTAFSRHRGLISRAEQERLRLARVAIAGMGGVGGVHLATLARLGIGQFTIADPDVFETANFNRQYGATVDALGRPKALVMAEEAQRINPDVEIRVFRERINSQNVDQFLEGADLFVDGIDFFETTARRLLFRRAAERGIHAITAGPIGFGTALLVFDPRGMSFDKYFDLHDGQTPLEQLAAFAVGLTPRLLQRPYLDLSEVSLAEHRGPSAGLACQLCAGVTAAESVKILLGRGPVRCAPCYSQFDAYRGLYRRGRVRGGGRNPWQRVKRRLLLRSVSRPGASR